MASAPGSAPTSVPQQAPHHPSQHAAPAAPAVEVKPLQPAFAPQAPTPPPPAAPRTVVKVNNISYEKLCVVGKGGSSQVLKVMAPNARIFAIKMVNLNNLDKASRAGFFEEVALLQRLRGKPGIIRIVDSEHAPQQGLLYVVLEYGEIDLAQLLDKKRRQWKDHDPFAIDAHFLGSVWRDMLRAVGVRAACALSRPLASCATAVHVLAHALCSISASCIAGVCL
jgi:Protein kinase domain